jgi:hypothetical protein
MDLCLRGHRAHQVTACTPTYVEHRKCSSKLCGRGARRARARPRLARRLRAPLITPLPPRSPDRARAVDILCRPQFVTYAACLNGASGDASKCVPSWQAFDVCTEGW